MSYDYKYEYVKGRIGPEEYLQHALESHHLNEVPERMNKVSLWLKETIIYAFWELNSMSRDDPFWTDTNKLPTLSKLLNFAEYNLDRGYKVVLNAWTAIAVSFLYNSGHLKSKWWMLLKKNNAIDYELLVETAWYDSGCWDDRNISTLALLVTTLDIKDHVSFQLDKLASRGKNEREWVNDLRAKLQSA